jgi:hypothetical protein
MAPAGVGATGFRTIQGKLAQTDYLFTGVSYKEFHAQFRMALGDDTWKAYRPSVSVISRGYNEPR